MVKLLTSLICTVISVSVFSQNDSAFDELGQLSPKSTTIQKIGITDIEIVYYRPSVNKRQIWGDEVKYGEVWRAGANFTTFISFSTDVKINGKDLPAGKYALFVIPEKKEWTFIFDKNLRQFGAFLYTGKSDVLRVSSPVQKSRHIESLMYYFDDLKFNEGNLVLTWGDISTSFTISTSKDQIINQVYNVANKAKENSNSQFYVDCVAWALDHGLLIAEAREWLKASQDIEKTFPNQFLEARFAAYDLRYDEAISIAHKVGEKYPYLKTVTESFSRRWMAVKGGK